jgi:hypothetical protein
LVYLVEHEVGFDTRLIGFPSISGCHAIVYVTDCGLYGYHNAGGSANADWAGRAQAFLSYVQGHHAFPSPGSRLYGATYVAMNRGYKIDVPRKESWRGELTAFATALNFGGKIRGYDLTDAGFPPSAYVEFRKVGEKCEIWVKKWDPAHGTLGPNTQLLDVMILKSNGIARILGQQNLQVTKNVTTAGLQHVHSTRLRH